MADRGNDPVVVTGHGSSLALELVRQVTEVTAIDHLPKAVRSLAGRLPHVVADSTEPAYGDVIIVSGEAQQIERP
ncbi:hypothetical protein [Streptosporangium saharense]|uniref:hypothetical protein n=1 Tax=Streptosporangium saharense TaxID=1706840 RepID=UPI003325607A